MQIVAYRQRLIVMALAVVAAALSSFALAIADDSIMQALGAPTDSKTASVHAGDVKAIITPTTDHAAPGQEVEVTADFDIGPGWHIYGAPIPQNYTPTSVTFDKSLVESQSFQFPTPVKVTFASIGETVPVYKDSVHATGKLKVRRDAKPGDSQLTGKVSFQECNDQICKIPQSIAFAIPFRIDSPK